MGPKIPSAPGSLLMHRQLELSIVSLLSCAVVSIVGFMVLG